MNSRTSSDGTAGGFGFVAGVIGETVVFVELPQPAAAPAMPTTHSTTPTTMATVAAMLPLRSGTRAFSQFQSRVNTIVSASPDRKSVV